MKYEVKRKNETLDAIVYNFYGSVVGYLELVLTKNPMLYKQGIVLEIGTIIDLPEVEVEAQNRISLWN